MRNRTLLKSHIGTSDTWHNCYKYCWLPLTRVVLSEKCVIYHRKLPIYTIQYTRWFAILSQVHIESTSALTTLAVTLLQFCMVRVSCPLPRHLHTNHARTLYWAKHPFPKSKPSEVWPPATLPEKHAMLFVLLQQQAFRYTSSKHATYSRASANWYSSSTQYLIGKPCLMATNCIRSTFAVRLAHTRHALRHVDYLDAVEVAIAQACMALQPESPAPVHVIVKLSLRPRQPSRSHETPLPIALRVHVSHVPARLDKNSFVRVEGDAVVRPVSTGVDLVVALPVALVAPIHGILVHAARVGGTHSVVNTAGDLLAPSCSGPHAQIVRYPGCCEST